MADCIHEIESTTCSYCRPTPRYQGPYWDALYPGLCVICQLTIEVGDRVRWSRDNTDVQHAKHK